MDALLGQRALEILIDQFQSNTLNAGRQKFSAGYLRGRIELLERYWSRFQQNHIELLKHKDELQDQAYFEGDTLSTTETVYATTLGFLYDEQQNLQASASHAALETGRQVHHSYLPKISLPAFSGLHEEWEPFRDLFSSMIHRDNTLTAVQKLYFLRSAVQGEALTTLEGIPITEANYSTAWNLLLKRYDNKRLLVQTHFTGLATIRPLQDESASGLRTILDTVIKRRDALNSIGRPTSHWDDWFVFYAARGMDPQTRRDWERSLGDDQTCPTFQKLNAFLQGRIQALRATEPLEQASRKGGSSQGSRSKLTAVRPGRARVFATSVGQATCQLCSAPHYIGHCEDLTRLDPSKRRDTVMRLHLCLNCLRPGHFSRECSSKGVCLKCQARHHTTLHDAPNNKRHASRDEDSKQIKRRRLQGDHQASGSSNSEEASFATSALVQRLGIPLQEANVIVHAIGGHQAGTSQRKATISIQQRGGRCDIHVDVLILRHLGVKTPQMPVRSQAWINESSLDLADPHYMIPSSVEILLGADVYGSLMLDGVQHGPLGVTVAQRTTLGWVVTGPANPLKTRQPSTPKLSALSTIQKNNQLGDSLSKFWEQEELSRSAVVSPDDLDCEKLHSEGQRRDDVGRYIVRLPLRSFPTNKLEGSLVIAQRLHRALDNRLRRDSKLRESYNQFMSEYERLGHMRPLLPSQQNSKGESAYYIPHHGIWKETEGRSKLRVVFNASQPTTSGTTLNQLLHVGPKLQNDLPTILMRWRFHKVAFSADIQMMYRQIRIDERDVDLQRILWKRPGDTKETHYQLMTVTYGLACAPYLAIRTLQQLAADEGDKYPNAARVLRQDTYVDDILTGAEDEDSAKMLGNELIALTEAGRFHLKKWVANRQSITEAVSEDDRLRPYWKDFRDDGPTKALGISWDPVLDEFRFKPPQFQVDSTPTKRQILSAIARLFDPIGWLSPITIVAKILLQDIWREGLDWDDLVPRHLNVRWTKFWSSLTAVTDLTIPRWLGFNKSSKLEIHGFADASKLAYAAVIHLRMCHPDGTGVSRMITAKTRVAPTKTITIPRLELRAAVLVTKLLRQVITELDFRGIPIHAWSDSKTVLAWLRSDSSRWSVFVANRVSEVQQTLPEARWNFVSTLDNPADVASRGTDPRTLQGHRLWWQGPAWLVKPQSNWPTDVPRDTVNDEELPLPELKGVSCQQIRVTRDAFHRFSGLTRLLRVIARCLRFRLCLIESRERRDRIQAPLSSKELDHAFLACVAWSQSVGFQQELATISEGRNLTRRHPMSCLRPFLDRRGILRVGGRLEYASLPYDQRHPVILPSRCHLSTLVIDWAHKTALHGGSQLTHANVLRKAWILRGASRVKSYVRNCVTCNRTRPRRSEQQMGNLPAERVTASSRPFSRVGLDYAGPLSVKTTKGRGHRCVKGYVAFFVCLSTKAVHLELVGDLTTNSFLAALKRFAGRRGPPREIWSDNATTFHGANTALHAMLREAEIDWEQVADSLANEGIQWSFIPPGAPHFGGLWEAAVKSAKSHLKRVIGTQTFSYEELYTFLVQIEMCMDSRPLTAITGEVDDLNVLTPGHFLVGTTLNRIPEPTYPERSLTRETHWRLIQAMRDHFWRRWAREYLHTLQQRYKWTHPRENHQVNDIVVVMDPSLLEQGRWPLGRVVTVHPGRDGLVRVVTVKTRTGTYVRPIVKICKLPVVHDPPTPINENDH